jgi:hypothetical protein
MRFNKGLESIIELLEERTDEHVDALTMGHGIQARGAHYGIQTLDTPEERMLAFLVACKDFHNMIVHGSLNPSRRLVSRHEDCLPSSSSTPPQSSYLDLHPTQVLPYEPPQRFSNFFQSLRFLLKSKVSEVHLWFVLE